MRWQLLVFMIAMFSLQFIHGMQVQENAENNKSQEQSMCIICYDEENVSRLPCRNNHPLHYGICNECRKKRIHYGDRCWICKSFWQIALPQSPPSCCDTLPLVIKVPLIAICCVFCVIHVYEKACC